MFIENSIRKKNLDKKIMLSNQKLETCYMVILKNVLKKKRNSNKSRKQRN